MDIDKIYNMRTKYKEYKHCKFVEHLENMQKIISGRNNCKREDEETFENYLAHKVATITKKGQIQYQGSYARKLILADMEEGLDKFMVPKALWQSQEEYKAFDLKPFCDYIAQERRTKRYLKACEEDGRFKY